jgi:hypothetical protein
MLFLGQGLGAAIGGIAISLGNLVTVGVAGSLVAILGAGLVAVFGHVKSSPSMVRNVG